MPGFKNFREIIKSHTELGTEIYSYFRIIPNQATTIGIWFDLSMSPGNPAANYWYSTPLKAQQIKYSTHYGIFNGASVSPKNKYLRETMILASAITALPMPMMLIDYLLYYPNVNESILTAQTMDNTNILPRYIDGDGVQIMAVSTSTTRIGGQSFVVNYTNSQGVSNRTSKTVVQNSVSVLGSIVTSNRNVIDSTGPFIALQDGDSGVRSIESITMNGADIGTFALLLVKPIAQLSIRGTDAPVEIDYLKNFNLLPQIHDDACLNFICLPQGSLAATTILGNIKIVFN